MAVGATGKLKTRFVFLAQVPALYAHQATVDVVVRDEERGRIVEGFAIPPTGGRPRDTAETAPSYDARVKMALVKEEMAGRVVQVAGLDEGGKPSEVNLAFTIGRFTIYDLRMSDNIRSYGQNSSVKPLAGLEKTAATDVADEVDHSAMGIADVTTVPVGKGVERKRGMAVVMERTKGFVAVDMEAKTLSYILNGGAFETCYFMLFYHKSKIIKNLTKTYKTITS